jgi:hypothetical protein
MYLATILGFCALTTPSVAVVVSPGQISPLVQENQPQTDAPPSSPQENPQGTAPVSSPQEPSQPSGETKSETPPPPQAPPTPEATPQPQKAKPEASAKKPEPKAKTATKKRRRKHRVASTPGSAPEKKVVRNGGTADPVVQLAPGMSDEQASRQRQSTTQLLATTDANLKQISTRQLGPGQQDSVSQIRKYMEQAKAAEEAGDVQRAHNLASKALLLSDDLVKH